MKNRVVCCNVTHISVTNFFVFFNKKVLVTFLENKKDRDEHLCYTQIFKMVFDAMLQVKNQRKNRIEFYYFIDIFYSS